MKTKLAAKIIQEFVTKAKALEHFTLVESGSRMCLLQYTRPGFTGRGFLRFELIEKKTHCGFMLSCLWGLSDSELSRYMAVDLPAEVAARGRGAFDIGLLFGPKGHAWSVLNDRLEMGADGVFSGTEESVERRIPLAVDDALKKVVGSFVPWLSERE